MTVPTVKFSHYDTADYLQTEEDIAGKAIQHFLPSARSLTPWECAYLLNRYPGQKRAARKV